MFNQCSGITYNVTHTSVLINNTVDNELNEWKENLDSILKKSTIQEDALKPLIQLLVHAIAPSKSYLLRHRDAVENKEDYIDLLLVISNTCTKPFAEMEPVLEMAYLKNKKVSCSLHQEANLKYALSKGHLFYTLSIRPQNLIYEKDDSVLPGVSENQLKEVKARSWEIFSFYLNNAQQAYAFATNGNLPYTAFAAFLLHQAVEYIFRGVLLSLNGYEKKTHEIKVLKKHLRRCAPQLLDIFPDDTEEEKSLLLVLENVYLDARYNTSFTITDSHFNELQLRVKLLIAKAVTITENVLGKAVLHK